MALGAPFFGPSRAWHARRFRTILLLAARTTRRTFWFPAGSWLKSKINPENFGGPPGRADYNADDVFVLTRHERTRGQRRSVNRFLDRLARTLVRKEVVFDRHMF